MKIILETPRLILREVEESDLERKNEFELEGDTLVWFEKNLKNQT